MTLRKIVIASGLIAFFSMAFLSASEADYQEQQAQNSMYCTMVELNKQTGGEYGWPAYKGEGLCND